MKKYMSIVFVGIFLSGLPLVASQVQNDSEKNSNQENTPAQGGFFTSTCIKAYYSLTADTETEQAKFPPITIQKLLELLGKEKVSNETLEGKSFPYETGSKQGANDFYRGMATIESFDFGKSSIRYLGPKKGLSNITHTTWVGQEISAGQEANLRKFLETWRHNTENPVELFKGDPYKTNSDTLTRMDYILYNNLMSRFIKLTLKRERRS